MGAMKLTKGFVEINGAHYEAIQVMAHECIPATIYFDRKSGMRFTYCEKFIEGSYKDKPHNIFNIDQHENEQKN